MSRYEVEVSPSRANKEFAVVTLRREDGGEARIELNYTPVRRRCRNVRPLALDFLLIASCVYAADKLEDRDSAPDRWTRTISMTIPVGDPDAWAAQADRLAGAVGFLTGDRWSFEFSRLERALPRPKPRRGLKRFPNVRGEAVSLFSGGLDSLIGVIDWLETNPARRIVLVGHHDPKVAGPNSDQVRVFDRLRAWYGTRMDLLRIGVGNSPVGVDTNYRSRSILFLALGALVSTSLGDGVPLLVPENGTISLNVPLTPSRRGSCSTRTTHPYFLSELEATLNAVGLPISIENPLLGKTKGECVTGCLGQAVLVAVARLSRSCAKRGHTSHWTRGRDKGADQCGRCVPCIFRRAAMHAGGMDDETYGDDVCAGEIVLATDADRANDLRAVLAFLSKAHTPEDIGALLVSNGPLPLSAVADHAGTVFRAMEEVRELLRDKAVPEIRVAAGI